MENIYTLSDPELLKHVGARLKSTRLKQELSQAALAKMAEVSLSSLKRLEEGNIKSADVLIRILRTLGKLHILAPLVEEEPPSPAEQFKMSQAATAKSRKRAPKSACRPNESKKEEPEW